MLVASSSFYDHITRHGNPFVDMANRHILLPPLFAGSNDMLKKCIKYKIYTKQRDNILIKILKKIILVISLFSSGRVIVKPF
jgi:hypothetical protein